MTTCAAFTFQKDERYHLPQWIAYYSGQLGYENLYVIDHESTDEQTVATLDEFARNGGTVAVVHNDVVFDHDWMVGLVHNWQQTLLASREYVIFGDTDELLVPAVGTLREFIDSATDDAYRATGYELVEDQMFRSPDYDKTLLAKVPITWGHGYHVASPHLERTDDLLLYHLHRMNYAEAWAKNQRWATKKWDEFALQHGLSIQNQQTDPNEFWRWFYETPPLEPLHDRLLPILDVIA
jgi:hypothetical protein